MEKDSRLDLGFEVLTGSALTPGVVAAIQTFGDRINFHPHIHFLATEGGLDAAGVFHEIPRIDDARLAHHGYILLFAGESYRMKYSLMRQKR